MKTNDLQKKMDRIVIGGMIGIVALVVSLVSWAEAQASAVYTGGVEKATITIVNPTSKAVGGRIKLHCVEGPDQIPLYPNMAFHGEYTAVTNEECATQPKTVEITLDQGADLKISVRAQAGTGGTSKPFEKPTFDGSGFIVNELGAGNIGVTLLQ